MVFSWVFKILIHKCNFQYYLDTSKGNQAVYSNDILVYADGKLLNQGSLSSSRGWHKMAQLNGKFLIIGGCNVVSPNT